MATRAEITVTRSSAVANDGKLNVLITATGRDDHGQEQPLTIQRWTIDDKPPSVATGQEGVPPQLVQSLPAGKHRVSVTGIAADGKTLTADGVFDVQIKTEGSVKMSR